MSRLAHRWRTLRTAIRNANCRIQWVIEILNAYCTFGLCLEVCLYQCPYITIASLFCVLCVLHFIERRVRGVVWRWSDLKCLACCVFLKWHDKWVSPFERTRLFCCFLQECGARKAVVPLGSLAVGRRLWRMRGIERETDSTRGTLGGVLFSESVLPNNVACWVCFLLCLVKRVCFEVYRAIRTVSLNLVCDCFRWSRCAAVSHCGSIHVVSVKYGNDVNKALGRKLWEVMCMCIVLLFARWLFDLILKCVWVKSVSLRAYLNWTWYQTRLPAELKHINKRRKRN